MERSPGFFEKRIDIPGISDMLNYKKTDKEIDYDGQYWNACMASKFCRKGIIEK